MINLRFHIVSIVAVFLALAIGIFTGSTLLDRATVEVLQGRQRSLDQRNAELRTENEALSGAMERLGDAQAAFDADAGPVLLPGTITDRPVLLIAARGIDETSVRALQTAVATGGASSLGIVWIDSRMDLDDTASRSAVAAAISDEVDPGDVTKQSVAEELATQLAVATGTDSAAAEEDPASGEVVSADPTSPTTTDPALDVLSRLVDADLVDWESPTAGEPGSRTLPSSGLDLVVLGGEDSELRPSRFLTPLVKALTADVAGVVVGEVRRPRSPLDALGDGVPARGVFVDQFRQDPQLADTVITVDDVDEPFGRIAVVLALGQLPSVTGGAYGAGDSATGAFPTQPG